MEIKTKQKGIPKMNKELKGIEKLNEKISEFTENFGCSAEMGLDFCYWRDEEIINYSLIIPQNCDNYFTEYVLNTFDYKIQNIFMFSLLHEIGHHMNSENYTIAQRIFQKIKVKVIEIELNFSVFSQKKLFFQYFNSLLEKEATEWAIEYFSENEDEIEEFWKNFSENLREFYNANNLQ